MKVTLPFVRNPYNYDRNAAGDESGLKCEDESLTKQSFAEEADINTIVKRFHLTGELPQGVGAPTYEDFEGIFDFHSAMNAIARARESFDMLPPLVRARFENSPEAFVDFCSKEENRAEAERLGLVFKRPLRSDGDDGNISGRNGAHERSSNGGDESSGVAGNASGAEPVGNRAQDRGERGRSPVGEGDGGRRAEGSAIAGVRSEGVESSGRAGGVGRR